MSEWCNVRLVCVLLCVSAALTGGCAGTSILTTDVADVRVAAAYRPIRNDCQATRATQEAIAAHNSVHATVTTGAETVYRPKSLAECAKELQRQRPETS